MFIFSTMADTCAGFVGGYQRWPVGRGVADRGVNTISSI